MTAPISTALVASSTQSCCRTLRCSRHWDESFKPVAPSLEAFFAQWLVRDVSATTTEDQRLSQATQLWSETVERGIAKLAELPLEQRRAMGLPDQGWEEALRLRTVCQE